MAINTQIPMGVQPLQYQAPDPGAGLNALARTMQIGGMMDEQKLNALKTQEVQRGIDETNRLNQVYSGVVNPDGTIDRNKLFTGLATQNLGSRIPAVQKQLLDADTAAATLKKTQTDQQKTELEMGIQKAEHVASLFSLAKDPQSYGVVRNLVKQQFGQDLPEQFDPAFVQAQIAAGQTITQKLADEHQRLTLAETQRHDQAQEGLTARGQSITLRGQNLVDARSREANVAGRVPAGYRMNAAGNLEFIPGGPADPAAAKRAAPTEFQGKSATYGARAQEADKIIQALDGQYSPAAVSTKESLGSTPIIGGALEAGANWAMSPESQKAEQAMRDFINATLRQESGATIQPSEFENARKQYFPQPGDSPQVKAQKARNRQLVIAGFYNSSKPGSIDEITGTTPPGGAAGGRNAPAPGTVQGGYRFKGGNPADKNSWEPAK